MDISTPADAPGLPRVGDPAPDFALRDDAGVERRLSDERGRWVVLFFYPKDDTPGCTAEACSFRDSYGPLAAAGAAVWGISILGTASKAAFKAKLGLPFPLLADEEHAVAEAYGTWVLKNNYGKSSWGVRRSTILVDPAGRVARVWERVKPDGHAGDVLDAIREAPARDGRPAMPPASA